MKFGKIVKAAAATPVYGAERGRRTVTKGVDAAVESVVTDTPTAKARWVLMYIHFQIYSKAYKTNEFP